MEITPLTEDCADGRTCPGAVATDRETIVIRGQAVDVGDVPGVLLGDGEVFAEIPVSVFLEAARAYRE
jgi:hypothetical protein